MIAIDDCQTRLGLSFGDPRLLERALTHRSYVNEHPDDNVEDNERLEFLGDAALGFIVGEWLYNQFPDLAEGKLTRLRAGLVRKETLAGVARELDVGAMLRLGKGEEENGGSDRDNNLCGAFEAINGALYLDRGPDAVRLFVLPRLRSYLEGMIREASDKDAKSRFQEWSQSMLNLTPVYRVQSMTGPEHERSFTVEVLLDDTVYGVGIGSSKRAAEQEAARLALGTVVQDEKLNEESA